MSQNWSLAQDSRGFVYVGNGSCLLRFNGKSWERFYPFGENKEVMVRSLYYDSESDRLYIGSFQEFGYVEFDEYGQMQYTSLFDRVGPVSDSSEEIWYITRVGHHVFFLYFTSLYIFDQDTEEIHHEVVPTVYYYILEGKLHLCSYTGEVRIFDGFSFEEEITNIQGVEVSFLKVFDGGDGRKTAVSVTDGLYRVEGGKSVRIDRLGSRWDMANRAIQCSDGVIVIGFMSAGIYAFSPSGDVIWHIGTEEGLQDNTVLSLMEDDCGNIWCALDKGVSVIFKDGDGLLSMEGYNLGKTGVSLWDGHNLFVGSNHGLSCFTLDSETLDIRKVSNYFPNSQMWSLYEQDGQIFIGENGGEYVFSDGKMRHLSYAPGGTVPKLLTLRNGRETLIQGSFTSLYVYEKKDGQWAFSHTVDGFMRPIRHIEVDYLGNIWLEHKSQGLYKIVLTQDGMGVESEVKFLEGGARVCKMGGRVLFHDKSGFWWYDDREGKMVPFDRMDYLLGNDKSCRRVVPVGNDRYWLVRRSDALLVRFHNDEAELLDEVRFDNYGVSMTELFETIISLSDTRFCFGIEDGFLVHDLVCDPVDREEDPGRLRFSSILAFDGDKSYPVSLSSTKIVLPYNSSLSISLAVSGIKYMGADIKYELSGYDYEAGIIDPSMTVNYTRLPSGSYIFSAWIEDSYGVRMTVSVPVQVKPSVFASVPAILFYLLLAAGLALLVFYEVRRIMQRQLARLESEKEKEMLALRNEQLEASNLLKSKELATYSLIEASRNRVIQRMKEELSKMRYGKPGSLSKKEYDSLLAILREGEFSESDWAHFYENFDLIHKSFFKTLRQRHPDLTPHDLRICAYLRLNMSNKELADIMGVTLKGAEAAKYRLRKKLSVGSDVPLNIYLSQIDSN